MNNVSLWTGVCFSIVIIYVWIAGLDNAVIISIGMVILFAIFKVIYDRIYGNGELLTDEEEKKVYQEWHDSE
tara:strand:+ start:52 stop:267 length:216 start_codon:yes stop_codon:yes gene_type:complete